MLRGSLRWLLAFLLVAGAACSDGAGDDGEPDAGVEDAADAIELMFTEQVGGLYASDHLGVLCEFSLHP